MALISHFLSYSFFKAIATLPNNGKQQKLVLKILLQTAEKKTFLCRLLLTGWWQKLSTTPVVPKFDQMFPKQAREKLNLNTLCICPLYCPSPQTWFDVR